MRKAHPLKIVNIVASADIGVFIDLERLAALDESIFYEPSFYHAAKLRYDDLGVTVCIVKSGSLLFSGGKTLEVLEAAKVRVLRQLQGIVDEPHANPVLRIVNMVALFQWPHLPDLESLIANKSDQFSIVYDPERHPGVFVHFANERAAATVFSNGKVLVQGCKSYEEINRVLSTLDELVFA